MNEIGPWGGTSQNHGNLCVNHYQNNSGYTIGNVVYRGHTSAAGHGNYNQQDLARLLAAQCQQEQKRVSGDKPIVVCGGETREAKDMDDAQQIAESLAHSKSANAYILKPVKKVAPKRDVVTTDL